MSGATDAAAPACGLGAKGRCVPCESLDKSHVLSQDAVEKELAESLNMWKLKPPLFTHMGAPFTGFSQLRRLTQTPSQEINGPTATV